MSPRTRQLIGGVAGLVVLLFVGRWTAAFLSERWWAATISPAAEAMVTRWRLVGLALDATSVIGASVWFAVQALLVGRAIASVQVTRRIGNLQPRDAVPTRLLVLAAIGTGVLLGLVTGAGARQWRAPVMLAWQGANYGVTDPLLGEDLGVFAAQFPVWSLAQHFIAMLVVLGLAFAAMLYSGIGGLRRDGKTIVVHPDARRHLGGLLTLLALVISAAYLLGPYQLALAAGAALNLAAGVTQVRATQVMAGVSLGVALLCLVWTLRGRHALLVSGWLVLGLGALIEHVVIPEVIGGTAPAAVRDKMVRRFDGIAWGVRDPDRAPPGDSIPATTALWDENFAARLVERGGGALLAATPTVVTAGGRTTPAWLLATPTVGDSSRMDVLALQDGGSGAEGRPLLLASSQEAPRLRPVWRSLADPRLRPDAQSWRPMAGGVSAGGILRRLALAWAEQAPGMLGRAADESVDWHLDPVDRAAALLPMASWLPADVVIMGDRTTWVVQGVLPIDEFPVATRAHWEGRVVAGVVPAFVATMDAATGDVHIYLDPGADSLGTAWARVAGDLVQPAASLPADVRATLGYPSAWYAAQLDVLEGPAWGIGRRPTGRLEAGVPDWPATVWLQPLMGARQAAFEDLERRAVSGVVTARRVDGVPELRIDHYEPGSSPIQNAAELERMWGHGPDLLHLRDSARAAGDSVEMGTVRWFLGAGAMTAWQPVFDIPSHGAPLLLWVSAANGDRLGGGRTPADAWASVTAPIGAPATLSGVTDPATLDEVRHLFRMMDSAYARHDNMAAGRALDALRALLFRKQR